MLFAIAPYAARVPYEIWILLTRHASSFVVIQTEARRWLFAWQSPAVIEDPGDPPQLLHPHCSCTGRRYELLPLALRADPQTVQALLRNGYTGESHEPEQSAAFLSRKLTALTRQQSFDSYQRIDPRLSLSYVVVDRDFQVTPLLRKMVCT